MTAHRRGTPDTDASDTAGPAAPDDTADTAGARTRGLSVRIPASTGRRRAWVHAATDVDLHLRPGTTTALVGESGCGKSILASALCGLLPAGSHVRGAITVLGRDMTGARERDWRPLRGSAVGLAAQSAAAAFTPVRTIGSQLAEAIEAARDADARTGSDLPALLASVELDAAVADLYPHELSGGMAQRVAVASALAGRPDVIVADEPTAGLDPRLTARVLELLRSAAAAGAAVLVITHDLQALEATDTADRMAVMYASRIVEQGPADRIFANPAEPYTRALLAALPSRGLHPIPGLPPELTDAPAHHRFTDRLRAADTEETG